jgi:allantoicase
MSSDAPATCSSDSNCFAAANQLQSSAHRWLSVLAPTDSARRVPAVETRRRREPGHDWSVARLGARGIVRGIDLETTHFKGNYPEAFAIDVCDAVGQCSVDDLSRIGWTEVLAPTPLRGDAHNLFAVENAPAATYLRLRIFPDGGVARLRAHGEVVADWLRLRARGQIDLAAARTWRSCRRL